MSMRHFDGTPLIRMIAVMGGGFFSVTSGFSTTEIVGTLGDSGWPDTTSRYVLPSFFELIVGFVSRIALVSRDSGVDFESFSFSFFSFFFLGQSFARCPFSKHS